MHLSSVLEYWCRFVLLFLQFGINAITPLFSCDLIKCLCLSGFFGVYLRLTQGCGKVTRNGGGSGWASVPFVLYPPYCRGGWFHTTELFLRGYTVVVVLRIPLTLISHTTILDVR